MGKYHSCPDVRLEASLAVIAGPAFNLLSTTGTGERERSCQDNSALKRQHNKHSSWNACHPALYICYPIVQPGNDQQIVMVLSPKYPTLSDVNHSTVPKHRSD